jgi:hypothetical protein
MQATSASKQEALGRRLLGAVCTAGLGLVGRGLDKSIKRHPGTPRHATSAYCNPKMPSRTLGGRHVRQRPGW